MVEFRVTQSGRDALALLAAEVASAKRDDPLAPVTVLLPSHRLCVIVRRDLAALHGGSAGIHFTTLADLATQVAQKELHRSGRRALSKVVLVAAVRQVLRSDPGLFAPVAEHASTEQALAASYEELNVLEQADLNTLARQNERCAETVRIFLATRAILSPRFYDQRDLYQSAARTPLATGPVIAYLLSDLSAPATAFLASLDRDDAKLCVITTLTGHVGADREAIELLQELGHDGETALPTIPTGSSVISTSDPDEEIRAAVRVVVRTIAEGADPHRVAVLYCGTRPYARLVAEHLQNADLTYNGPGTRTLAETTPGRLLAALVRLSDHNLRRDDVISVFASASLRDFSGARIPTSSWDRISREAGIVAGDDWSARLSYHRSVLSDRALARDPSEAAARRTARDIKLCSRLEQTVAQLRAQITSHHSAPWSAYTELYRSLISSLLDPDSLDDNDLDDLGKVLSALTRLDEIDAIETEITPGLFRRTIEIELSLGQGDAGKLGQGICVGPLRDALGRVFDHVVIVGMVEGVLPGRSAEDSLIGDAQRQKLTGKLRLAAHRPDRQHRDLLVALATSPGAQRSEAHSPDSSDRPDRPDAAAMAVAHGSRTLCFARGDLRNATARIPSRWLVDTARHLSGGYVSSEDLHTQSYNWLSTVASFGYAIAESELPATRRDFRLQHLGHGLAQGAQLADLVTDDQPLKAAVEMQRSRWSSTFTRFDGNLSTEELPEVGTAYAVSPTQLEEWAKCPFGYFMRRFLRIEALTAPEQLLEISALDRGSLIHEVLERVIQEAIMSRSLPEPAEPWPPAAHDRVDNLFTEVAERFASEGRLGNALLWKKEGAKTLRELQQFLLFDNDLRAAGNYRPVSTEASFGFTDTPAVHLTLPDGTEIQFRGSADRIDRSDTGEILIIDYKSGGSKSFKNLSAANPVSSGQKLQLPIYGLAAQLLLDSPEAPTTAEYRFVSDQTHRGYSLTEDVVRMFGQTVQNIVEGIKHGVFPQMPIEVGNGKYNPCVYCDPDDLGITRVSAAWERKQHDPAVEIFHALDEIAP